MKPGAATSICMNGAFVKSRIEKMQGYLNDNPDEKTGQTDNITDLTDFLAANPGLDKVLELDDNTVEALMDKW